ncbi:MAG: GNAT family N-acetyltransferase [Candidatus Riflebacteria bacterium]|nr:GNAT family N-acetyltransferase [Candidatus Riflebacteria bacterium]
MRNLREFLQAFIESLDEIVYNEEIHRFNLQKAAPEEHSDSKTSNCISLILFDEEYRSPSPLSGFVLSFAAEGSGDWNIAHSFGDPAKCLECAKSLPEDIEFQVLFEGAEKIVGELPPEKQIIRFILPPKSDLNDKSDEQFNESCVEKISLTHPASFQYFGENTAIFPINGVLENSCDFLKEEKQQNALKCHKVQKLMKIQKLQEFQKVQSVIQRKFCEMNNENTDFPLIISVKNPLVKSSYMTMSKQIISLVKPIHNTENSVECYIETDPAFRNMGAGCLLLSEVVSHEDLSSKTIIYLVQGDNYPSIRIAEKAGFIEHSRIAKIPLKN